LIYSGEGPRTCIGKRFAQTVTKSTVAKILYNYELTVDRSRTSIPLKINPEILFVTPMDGIYVNLKKLVR
jgi:cytochrome P450 family 6